MKHCDVLVIGGGATGLMAAYRLSAGGRKVVLLEARDRLGGRINTLLNQPAFEHAELGAEFIHGNLPVTLDLLKTAGIAAEPASAEMWRFANGRFTDDDEAAPDWELLMQKLAGLKDDMPIDSLLQHEFGGDEHKRFRDAVRSFVSGYDTADPQDASAFALRREWQHEDEQAQHRVRGGYRAMINFLADQCKNKGGQLVLNSPVTDIHYQNGNVQVTTANRDVYSAGRLLVALPLGVLKASTDHGGLNLQPTAPAYARAFGNIGFGAVIKFLLVFNEPFWEGNDVAALTGKNPKEMGYILSDQPIPTWWTQQPRRSPLLTGWLGGPAARLRQHLNSEDLLQLALQSLGVIFKMDVELLRDKLVAYHCVNWTAEQYTLGSYAYDMPASADARKVLSEPLQNTVFFAGEYLYDGPAMGTVEAALTSGNQVAARLLKKS